MFCLNWKKYFKLKEQYLAQILNILLEGTIPGANFKYFDCKNMIKHEFSCQVSPGESIERLSPFKSKLRRTVTVSIEA